MAGIYIHVPFCKQACYYCNFHFSTSLKYKEELLSAINKEIEMRNREVMDPISTIYFGGGTPSLLSESEVENVLLQLASNFDTTRVEEVTFEVNPDDVNFQYLSAIKQLGVNRLSVGIQSFHDKDLSFMNRAHDRQHSFSILEDISRAGFKDFSIDLIYGNHTTTHEMWQDSIMHALSYHPTHISAYCLTIEEGTLLGHQLKKGQIEEVDQEKANQQFKYLQNELKKNNFIHYEVSNFALEGHLALHNTNYWKGSPYIGFGPSAHSFNGHLRSWNIANNAHYIKSINAGQLPTEKEVLSDDDKFNEYIMTSLRTKWGVDLIEVKNKFGSAPYMYLKESLSENHWFLKYVHKNENKFYLTQEGFNFADRIASELFLVND